MNTKSMCSVEKKNLHIVSQSSYNYCVNEKEKTQVAKRKKAFEMFLRIYTALRWRGSFSTYMNFYPFVVAAAGRFLRANYTTRVGIRISRVALFCIVQRTLIYT